MLADFYVDEPVISHWPWLAAFVAVVAGLAVAGALVVRDVRRSREHDAELEAREARAKCVPVPLSAEDTREIAVPREPGQVRSHRARNERPIAARVSNASDRFAATVTRVKERKS